MQSAGQLRGISMRRGKGPADRVHVSGNRSNRRRQNGKALKKKRNRFFGCQLSEGKGVCGKTVRVFLHDLNQSAAAAHFARGKDEKRQKEETGTACLFLLYQGEKYTSSVSALPNREPSGEDRGWKRKKARPAYEKALRPFQRLRAFSELYQGGKNTF